MIDRILLRDRVRTVLAALPANRRASEQLIFDKLKPDFPDLRADDLRVSIEWNQGKGWIDYRYNADQERDEWFLSERGRQKEGLA